MSALLVMMTVVYGTVLGWLDVHGQSVQVPALFLFVTGALLAAANPDGAWRRALMLGLSVPLAHLIGQVTGIVMPHAVESYSVAFLALVPAMAGSAAGAAARRARDAQQRDDEQKQQSRP
jgi:hypothetical protein